MDALDVLGQVGLAGRLEVADVALVLAAVLQVDLRRTKGKFNGVVRQADFKCNYYN